MTFVVVFGSTPDLAWQELITLIPSAERISNHTAVIHDEAISPQELMDRLGGAIKIGRLSSVVEKLDASTLTPILSLVDFRTFGISSVDTAPVPTILLSQIKDNIGRPTRFITGQLSAVVVSKQKACDFMVFPYRGKFGVAVTATVQNFEEWTRRDRGRPHSDPKAGMLPPKVARMMVNIARPPGVLLDPFCGMGTILAEALLMGFQVVGADQSADVVRKAEANLRWLGLKNYNFFVSDATHISENVKSVDAIVTEPFMGKPNVSEHIVANVVTGLEKLYIGCLKDWRRILKPNGKVVMAFPRFTLVAKSYFVKKVIDSCETLGYTVLAGPIEYSRPTAKVRREIFVLKKYGTR